MSFAALVNNLLKTGMLNGEVIRLDGAFDMQELRSFYYMSLPSGL